MSRDIDVKALVSHLVRGDGADKCRICMGDTSEGQVYLGDTVMMDGDRPVTLAELLEVITGVEVDLAPSLPERACQPCVESATLAAPFVRLCHASDKKWHEITNYLAEIDDSSCKSTFVFVNDDDIVAVKDAKPLKSTRRALHALNVRRRQKTVGNSQCDVKCPKCDKRFTSVALFNVHLKDLMLKMCYKCDEIVSTDSYLNHVKKHNLTAFMCNGCSTIFHAKGMFIRHRSVCKYRGSVICVECKRRFPSHSNLVAHVARNHYLKVCTACGKEFSKLCFSHHLKNCADSGTFIRKYICDYCSREYNFKNALKLHIWFKHVAGSQYQCETCGKKFSNPAHLKEHDNTHNRVEDRYICSICGCKYSTRRGYERHYKRHFNSDGEITSVVRKRRKPRDLYMCIICSYSTVNKKNLDKHLVAKHNFVEWDVIQET